MPGPPAAGLSIPVLRIGGGGRYRKASTAAGDPKTMNGAQDQIEIDVCGLEPPEPLQRTLEALSRLKPGQRLRMLIDRGASSPYGILARNGYSYETTLLPDYLSKSSSGTSHERSPAGYLSYRRSRSTFRIVMLLPWTWISCCSVRS